MSIIINAKKIRKNLSNIKNIIAKRIAIDLCIKKYADFISDLKSFSNYEKYFVTKEDSNKKIEEKKKNEKGIYEDDLEWWEPTGFTEEFYMYTHPGNGGLTPLYAICKIVEFIKRGYDEHVCITGLYKCDENGNEISGMIGKQEYKNKNIAQTLEIILDKGMIGWGKHYYCGGSIFYDINQLKPLAEKETLNINNNVKK